MNLDNFNSLIELFLFQSEKQDPESIFLQWLNPNNKKNFTWKETKINPPSRSAKLRYAIKIADKGDFIEFLKKFDYLIEIENLNKQLCRKSY